MASELDAIRAARAATAKVKQQAEGLASRYAELVAERDKTRRQLAPVAECISNAKRLVDEKHAAWMKAHGGRVVRALSGGLDFVDGSTSEREVRPRLPRFTEPVPQGSVSTLSLEDLAGLVPELLKQSLEKIVREAGADHAQSNEAREKRLAEIDAALAACESEHTTLVDSARELGIDLPLLQHVAVARDRAREGGRVPDIAHSYGFST